MSVNSYLQAVASCAVIRDREKESIKRSILGLERLLDLHFYDEISESLIFGSYTRGTILPRSMDKNSDIDYMVVFEDSSSQPQTYLDRLRRFAATHYSRSEVAQSNPTIVLTLNHIKFEIVPAVYRFWHGISIPARRSYVGGWMATDPNDFNEIITSVNKSNNNLIKPMIRVVKYWNALNRYPFASYELEKRLAGKSYLWVGGLWGPRQLQDYFFYAMRSLDYSESDPKYKIDAIERAWCLIDITEHLEAKGQNFRAEEVVRRLVLPPKSLL